MRSALCLLLFAISLAVRADTYDDVAKVLGPGKRIEGGYQAVRLRTDLQIQNHAGMLISPEMGLESSVEITKGAADGALCVVYEEIAPVVDILREGSFDLTGLGNRLAGESPSVYFLEFSAKGEPARLATVLKSALAELGKERLINEGLQRTGQYPVVDWKAASAILGQPIEELGSSRVMQSRSNSGWARFGGCPCGRTQVLVGTICATSELQAAIDAGRKHRLTVTSIQRTAAGFDLVFEGEGDALALAGATRAVWLAAQRGPEGYPTLDLQPGMPQGGRATGSGTLLPKP